ncbi:MAG: flagellar hook-associated protein FlgK [Candidatus Scalindua sediminis]
MASSGLSIGLTGLLISQRALQTIGHNLANVNTPGYSRQVNSLSARDPLSTTYGVIGQGVTLDEIRRIKDDLIDSQIQNYTSLHGSAEVQNRMLKILEGIFNELSEFSLSNTIEKFFQSIQELTINPEFITSRYQLLQDGINLANTVGSLDTQFKRLMDGNAQEINTKITELNNITSEIVELNKRISVAEVGAGNANDLKDKRDVLVTRLSKLADIRVINNDNGTINILLGGAFVVHENNTEILSTTSTGQGTVRIDGIAVINSGELKGLLDLQDVFLTKYIQRLDTLAASIIKEVNNIHSEGVGLSGGFTTLTSTITVNNATDQLSNTGLAFPPTVGTYTTGTITSLDNADGTTTVTGVGTTFIGNVNPTDWIRLGDGNYYRILSVDSNTQLTVSGALTDAVPVATDVTDGSLYITVTDDTTGAITKTSISIAANETLNTLATKIDSVANLNATVTGNTMNVFSDNGYTYNFTQALDTNPGSIGANTVSLSGHYNGSDNDIYTLTVIDAGTGSIGTGSALIRVTDASGAILANLDVGSSYTAGPAGDVLQISDGLSVSFGGGNIAVNDTLTFDVVSDSDTTNVLTALGLNTFFEGQDASTIDVTQYIKDDVTRIAAASSSSPGDNTNALRLASLQDSSSTNNSTFSEFLHGVVAELGIDTQQKESEKESFSSLLFNLENQRQEISGVSVEEEMINIIRFQQAFQASARYVSVISELSDLLMSLK